MYFTYVVSSSSLLPYDRANKLGLFVEEGEKIEKGRKRFGHLDWKTKSMQSRRRALLQGFLASLKFRSCSGTPQHHHRSFLGERACLRLPITNGGNGVKSHFQTFHSSVYHEQGLIYHGNQESPTRLLVVQPRLSSKDALKARLYEALRLADSLEELREESDRSGTNNRRLPPHVIVQNPVKSRHIHADAYFGAGTVKNVQAHVLVADSQGGVDAIFVNASLSPVQQRNLERAWGKPVLDRVALIIEIFGAHAETREAKLQVELAALNYLKSRLVRVRSKEGRLTFGLDFEAEVVSGRGRGSGGRGFISGAGESEIELQRRRISDRKSRLLKMLEEVRRTRGLHRVARQKHGSGGDHIPVVAVVGYTNAGKSSLVSALSQSDLYVEDKLFATLDTRSRSVALPSGCKIILSDTVGFISDLPIQLVQAFHATLEEVVESDFLLHVIDSSAPNAEEQRISVLQVLGEIGVPQEKLKNCMIEAWNKIDLLEDPSSNESGISELDDASLGLADIVEEEDFDSLEKAHSEGMITSRIPEDNCFHEGSNEAQDFRLDDEITDNYGSYSTKTVKVLQDAIPRVETSAVKGTGLADLLRLIDTKFMSQP